MLVSVVFCDKTIYVTDCGAQRCCSAVFSFFPFFKQVITEALQQYKSKEIGLVC